MNDNLSEESDRRFWGYMDIDRNIVAFDPLAVQAVRWTDQALNLYFGGTVLSILRFNGETAQRIWERLMKLD